MGAWGGRGDSLLLLIAHWPTPLSQSRGLQRAESICFQWRDTLLPRSVRTTKAKTVASCLFILPRVYYMAVVVHEMS